MMMKKQQSDAGSSDKLRASSENASETLSSKLAARSSQLSFVFFGAGPIAAAALHEMEKAGVVPALIVTAPDRPQGRGGVVSPSPVGAWAAERNIETLKPERLDDDFLNKLKARSSGLVPVFLVIDYGKILPKALLDIPEKGVLNMHPSLLPRLRGPSPIRSAILTDEKNVGVSVMILDEKLDHGPILAQKKVMTPDWPMRGRELDSLLAREGGKLVAEILPLWLKGEIEPQEQNHDVATYCQMFSKEDGLLDLADDPYKNLLKIRAFDGWPGTYTFVEKHGKNIRVQILDAHITSNKLVIDRLKPEGKKKWHTRISFDDRLPPAGTIVHCRDRSRKGLPRFSPCSTLGDRHASALAAVAPRDFRHPRRFTLCNYIITPS
jgi:methionyl-tRNA formyltransferase